MTKKKYNSAKPYVRRSTIWKAVGGGFSNAGEAKVCKVGKYKVLVTRANKLDRYGNPVHTATVINKDGTVGSSYRANGNASLVVQEALRRSGVSTK